MSDYLKSNRKKLKDFVDDVLLKNDVSSRELSSAIGYAEGYLCGACGEAGFKIDGDISSRRFDRIVSKINNQTAITSMHYKKSRCFKLKQEVAKAAAELDTSEGQISLQVSEFLKDVKPSVYFLSNKMTLSAFCKKGDIPAGEFGMLNNLIRKVVRLGKESEHPAQSHTENQKSEPSVNQPISYKRIPKASDISTQSSPNVEVNSDPFAEFDAELDAGLFGFEVSEVSVVNAKEEGVSKTPTMLSPHEIAEKIKQQLGYSSAMWVDGYLVLNGGVK